ncbi:MAG: Txe/YoeB family addiction module toxin [Candidatus Sericytochromatia bacterium]
MIISFHDKAWEEYLYWQLTDKNILKKINTLIKDIIRNPNDNNGLGKPELLKGNFQGLISRRINDEHRLVYLIKENNLIIIKCKFHYNK